MHTFHLSMYTSQCLPNSHYGTCPESKWKETSKIRPRRPGNLMTWEESILALMKECRSVGRHMQHCLNIILSFFYFGIPKQVMTICLPVSQPDCLRLSTSSWLIASRDVTEEIIICIHIHAIAYLIGDTNAAPCESANTTHEAMFKVTLQEFKIVKQRHSTEKSWAFPVQ